VPALTHDTRFPGPAPTVGLPARTVVVIGDSAAAGHGLPDADAALPRQVGRRLAARTGCAVEVVSLAVDGATTADVHADQVPRIPPAAEVVVVGVGVNDAVRGRSPGRVQAATGRLLTAVRERAPEAVVVLLTCPDLAGAPGLPEVLRPVLGRSCRRVAAAQRAVAARLAVAVAPADGHLPAAAFGPDGFHPGPLGVAVLADRVDAALRGRAATLRGGRTR
jgi:lysophospholipase L1-like esterase